MDSSYHIPSWHKVIQANGCKTLYRGFSKNIAATTIAYSILNTVEKKMEQLYENTSDETENTNPVVSC